MIRILFLLILLPAILADVYIYRRFVRRSHSKSGKRLYIAYALLFDVVMLAATPLFFVFAKSSSHTGLLTIMWMIGLFFLNAIPKIIYMVISLLDYIPALFGHRHTRFFGWIGTALGLYVFCLMLWGMTVGRTKPEVKQITIESADLPQSFDGFRIAFFTDVHFGAITNPEKTTARIVETVNSLDPDVVVNGGDLVNLQEGELTDGAMALFKGLKAPVYSVMGNHDLGFYMRDTTQLSPAENVRRLIAKERSMGWNVLVNETVYVHRGGDSIAISGVGYPADSMLNNANSTMAGADVAQSYRNMPDSVYGIMIAHTPNMWDEIRSYNRSHLTLSGHVHAMQMKVKFGRHEWSPAAMLYKRWSGLYEEPEGYLYINDGIGYVMYPMRINTRPEITLITLRRK